MGGFFKGLILKDWFLILCAFLIALCVFSFGQKIVSDQFLGDDKIYGVITQYLPDLLANKKLDDYRVKRILPLALVHYPLKWFRVPLSFENVRNGFVVWHIVLYPVIAFFWVGIVRHLKISVVGKWIGFCAIFFNFHLLKHLPYVSVNTDIFAYSCTFALVYFYLRNSLVGMIATALIGSFSWPTILHMAILLILFPKDDERMADEFAHKSALWGMNWILPLGLSVFLIRPMIFVFNGIHSGRLFDQGIFSMGAIHPDLRIMPLSIGILFGYLFFVLGPIVNTRHFFDWNYWRRIVRIRRVIVVFVLIGIVKYTVHQLAGSYNARPFEYLVANLLIAATAHPAGFLVSHAAFFGPIVLFVLFLGKPLLRAVHRQGVGLILCFVIAAIFALDAESRKQMNAYPVFLPFLIKAVDDMNWTVGQFWFFAALSLFCSRFWFWISGPVAYMHAGPWMSHEYFYILAVGTLLIATWIAFGYFRKYPHDPRQMSIEKEHET